MRVRVFTIIFFVNNKNRDHAYRYDFKGKSEVQVLISCTICGVTALFLCATFWKLQLMPDYARINA